MRRLFFFIFALVSVHLVFNQEIHDNSDEPGGIETIPEIETFGEDFRRSEEFWIGVYAGTAMYSSDGLSIGGGLELGYGKGISIGLKAIYFADSASLTDVLEICFLLRFYLFGINSNSGLFLQTNAGQAVFFRREKGLSIPGQWGLVSAGLSAGWRFLLGNNFYFEPVIGGGYPYFFGAGMSAGVRF